MPIFLSVFVSSLQPPYIWIQESASSPGLEPCLQLAITLRVLITVHIRHIIIHICIISPLCSYRIAKILHQQSMTIAYRGTLKLNTLKATLQMVNHLVEVAVSMSDSQVQDMSWFDFLDDINEPELIQYLKERRLYVNEPVNANTEEA